MGGPELLGAKYVWPFFIGMAGSVAPKVNTTRVVEALVIAAVTAAVTTWGNTRAMEADMLALKANQAEIQQDIRELRAVLLQGASK